MVNRIYGLIGRKLGHSFSARFFNTKFQEEGADASYSLFEIPSIECVPKLLAENPRLVGFNVTIPYKQLILPYLTSLSPAARAIGAVNTVRVCRFTPPTGALPAPAYTLEGDNTDAPGFLAAIRPLLPPPLPDGGSRALVLGTGGASMAVAYALKSIGIGATKVSRRKTKGAVTYAELTPEVMRSHNIVVNCTPLGMWPDVDSAPEIPYHLLNEAYLCYDLVYNPEVTEFMRRASAYGARTSGGLQMLINQALLAREFWESPRERLYMSRRIEVQAPDGSAATYPLSIARLTYGADNSLISIDILPYSAEIPSVEYVDTPLCLRLPS